MRGVRRGGVFLDPYEYVETKLSMRVPILFLLPTHLYWVKAKMPQNGVYIPSYEQAMNDRTMNWFLFLE